MKYAENQPVPPLKVLSILLYFLDTCQIYKILHFKCFP